MRETKRFLYFSTPVRIVCHLARLTELQVASNAHDDDGQQKGF